jgi:hypothetical protein
MKVVCDKCGAIIPDKEKVRVDLLYPFDIYKEMGGDLRFVCCVPCSIGIRKAIEMEMDSD